MASLYSKTVLQALRGKTVLFVYDGCKPEGVEQVFAEGKVRCKRTYAGNVGQVLVALERLQKEGTPPDLIVTDYDFGRDGQGRMLPTGGELFEDIRAGKYGKLLPNETRIPVIFDTCGDEMEVHRNKPNVYIRVSGGSLVEHCAVAMQRLKDASVADTVSRKPAFYSQHLMARDLLPDINGLIVDDDAHVRHLKAVLEEREKEKTDVLAKHSRL